jgi:hypothetical protein
MTRATLGGAAYRRVISLSPTASAFGGYLRCTQILTSSMPPLPIAPIPKKATAPGMAVSSTVTRARIRNASPGSSNGVVSVSKGGLKLSVISLSVRPVKNLKAIPG